MSLPLSEINKHNNDSRVRFRDEGHKYWVDNDDTDLVSSTTFIHKFFEHFDIEEGIKKILNSPKYKDPDYEYYDMTASQIKQKWKDASDLGTKMHKDIEDFYNGIEIKNDTEEFKYFLNFYEEHKHLKIYRTEWLIFSDILKITGSIDATFINEDGTLTLGDWKRSKGIKEESFGEKTGYFPLSHVPDCNYYHYSLQLNLYRTILEKFYGHTVKEMFLIITHPKNKNENYLRINVKKMDKEIQMMLDHRKEELIKKGYSEDIFKNLNLEYTLKDSISTYNPLMEEDEEYNKPIRSFLRRRDSSPESLTGIIEEEKKSFLKAKKQQEKVPSTQENVFLNKGKRWTEEEDMKLMYNAAQGTNLEILAKKHKRTPSALKIRIMQNLMTQDSEDIDDLIKSYPQISKEEMITFKEKESKKKKEEKPKTKEKKMQLQKKKINTVTVDSLEGKQKEAYNLILNGKNVFLTGKAGTGKSLLIELFYKEYKNLKNIGITSTTGTSAILIGGSTVHSYLGIGLGKGDVEILYMGIKNRGVILKRWIELDVLIIDEVSMLSPELFDKLENLARVIRKNDKPFGGIQLMLTGDCLQLPVVNNDKFCFEAKSWKDCVDNVIYLTENFRQDDPKFQKCLSEVRIGKLSKESFALLKTRENANLSNELGIFPTKLYSLNKNVDEENQIEVNKLFTKNTDLDFYEYNLEHDILKKGFKNVEKVITSCNAPNILELCVGVQVMLLYNMDLEAKLANGSRGVVVRFEHDMPVVKFMTGEERLIDYYTWKIEENGVEVMYIKQIPLKIAYAVTIHRSQGLTLDCVEIDMDGIFEDGQAYVALSRVKSLEGLSVKNLKIASIFANEKALKFYEDLE